ncbi:protein translocase subunit SecF [Nocardioides cynanchi]|uniref:protein translocase subunit SecF n=1 Tax=Nocardioides cynanchi TaxID=2558918 RepID=UPI0012471CE4|nr:protein translocase subunit SecF [Nocardioides cynanchi]
MGKFSRLGNDLYSGRRSIDFVGRRHLWYAISGVIIIAAVLGLWFRGLNFGIEFVGGAEYTVTMPSGQATQANADKLRTAVADTGIPAAKQVVVTTAGTNSILVQTEPLNPTESNTISATIEQTVGVTKAQLSIDEIGPSWGKEVAKRSITGLFVFLILVVLFIWAYFRQWKMSFAAIVALIHDLVITVGIYALSGFEVTPATVTGVLTILGFSLYDTVVVFDKVRENTKNLKASHQTYAEAANLAVNQTLVRSINTSIVALIPVGAILYVGAVQLGSGPLKDLALALFVGMAAGAYSSIFIATPMLAHMKSREAGVQEHEKRLKVRRRHEADRYASVPTFTDDMAVGTDPDAVPVAGAPAAATSGGNRPTPSTEALGRGRVVPPARGPVRPSGASGRVQPTRQAKSKRGKK